MQTSFSSRRSERSDERSDRHEVRPRGSATGRPEEAGSEPGGCRLALAIASAAFDVPAEQIRSDTRRKAEVAAARHVAIYLAHVVFQAPMQAVGEAFGRDRTSVRHALRRVEDRRDEPAFDRLMDRLERLAAFCGGRP